ncbi:MAG TPA: formate dehydrogenase subunit gamma [Rhodospirillaceae bacterium]|nr:formate dehydrogenase subunit gamma [Rhodospirillaceae bacterium]
MNRSRLSILIHITGFCLALFAAVVVLTAAAGQAAAQSNTPAAQSQGLPTHLGAVGSTSEMWRAVRHGIQGTTGLPDPKAGTLVQSEGDNLRAFRNGPLSVWGGWVLLAAVVAVALFFAFRGRIRIDAGPSGRTIERFNALERFTHWLTAVSFIVLALTGLNLLYGKIILLPVIGPSAFATMTALGKYAHNYIAFAFMIGVVLMLVLWMRHNIPNLNDLKWLALGGGLFSKGLHPPAGKFNAGQKIIFWAVILGGGSIAFSGICLLFPFEIHPFAGTFAILNLVGFDLPTVLTPLQETQLALLWHGIVALVLIAVVIGHIYIGSLGMEGALDAMTSGQVDVNWAHEHHSIWLDEASAKASGGDD